MPEITSDEDLRNVLQTSKTIAVLGAHPDTRRPSHFVPEYLHANGYRIVPVNPRYAGTSLWGTEVRATLAEIDTAVDLVDVFRPAQALPVHLDDMLAMQRSPSRPEMPEGVPEVIDFPRDIQPILDRRYVE